jgi:lysozyme family protein
MFANIMQFIHKWEGGYVNHPADPGGATNRGITQRTYDKWRTKKGLPLRHVKDMSPQEDVEIYREEYWNPEWEKLGFKLAACLMDTAVNMGPGRANQFLKQSGGDYVQFLQQRIAKYKEIVQRNSSLKVFEKGWMNRVTDLRRFVDSV